MVETLPIGPGTVLTIAFLLTAAYVWFDYLMARGEDRSDRFWGSRGLVVVVFFLLALFAVHTGACTFGGGDVIECAADFAGAAPSYARWATSYRPL